MLTVLVEDSAGVGGENSRVEASADVDARELPAVDRRGQVGSRISNVGDQAETRRDLVGRVVGDHLASLNGTGRDKAGGAKREDALQHSHCG